MMVVDWLATMLYCSVVVIVGGCGGGENSLRGQYVSFSSGPWDRVLDMWSIVAGLERSISGGDLLFDCCDICTSSPTSIIFSITKVNCCRSHCLPQTAESHGQVEIISRTLSFSKLITILFHDLRFNSNGRLAAHASSAPSTCCSSVVVFSIQGTRFLL